MKKSFKSGLINACRTILTILAMPLVLAAVLIWLSIALGKTAVAALFKHGSFSAG